MTSSIKLHISQMGVKIYKRGFSYFDKACGGVMCSHGKFNKKADKVFLKNPLQFKKKRGIITLSIYMKLIRRNKK